MIYVMLDDEGEYDTYSQFVVSVVEGPVADLDKLKVLFIKTLPVPADFGTLKLARWLVEEQNFTWVDYKLFEG